MGAPRTRPATDRLVYMPTIASTQYDPGDFLYEDDGSVYPASSQADAGSEAANQRIFASRFLGVCNGQKLSSDSGTDEIPVIVGSDVEFTLASATTVTVGTLLAADENSGGDGLLDQTVVVTTDPASAIAIVTENKTSATRCFAMPFNKFTGKSPAQAGMKVIKQTIAMGDAAVVLTKDPGSPTGTYLFGTWLMVDAESGTTENLDLPPEADMVDELLLIKNTGGETINLRTDAGGAVATIATSETCFAHCDGTAWTVMQHVFTT